MEVQPKLYYGLKIMARKFGKYGQVENIAVDLKIMPTYYVKYEKEENKIKALVGLKPTPPKGLTKMAQFAAFCIIKKKNSQGACPQTPLIR